MNENNITIIMDNNNDDNNNYNNKKTTAAGTAVTLQHNKKHIHNHNSFVFALICITDV